MPEARVPSALVVDDDEITGGILRALLEKAGYRVELALSGDEALARFRAASFEVVFMDLFMPGMDGVDTTRHIKRLAGDVFVPVIFVTGASDGGSLTRAIDAGGDDFLTKPIKAATLLAKLGAMARIRQLHERTRALYERVIEDQALAREVFDRTVFARHLSPALHVRLIPAEQFGGDLVLSAMAPGGDLAVLAGDFTGHGLAAALGAMPVANAFGTMVARGDAPAQILAEINNLVAAALPRGHFLAAALVIVDAALASVTLANCGMPPLVLWGRGGVRARVESRGLPLGIDADADFAAALRTLPVARGERLVIASDGVTEAANADGALFGQARLEAAIAAGGEGGAPAAIVAALERFCDGVPLLDDVSAVEIVLVDTLFESACVAPTALECA